MNEPNWADLFRMLSGMSRLLQSCTTEDEILDVMDWYVPRMFPDVGGSVHLFADADGPAGSMTWGDAARVAQAPGPDCRNALKEGRPVLAAAGAGDESGCPEGALTVPLVAAKRPLGVLQLASESEETLAQLQGLALVTAEHFALTVDNLRIRTRLKNLAVKDALTGLFNRRHFDETLNKETKAAADSGAPLSVVMFDIDHFKVLNDTKGHDAGDAALQSVGGFLGSLATKDHVACRYGGEEFFFILKNTTYDQALQKAETIRSGIAALDIKLGDIQVSPIHVSVGVARYPDHGDTPDTLAKAADDCLYYAKEHGRNQVVGHDSLGS